MTTLLPPKFGPYGGQFVPETLMPALIELEQAFVDAFAPGEVRVRFGSCRVRFDARAERWLG